MRKTEIKNKAGACSKCGKCRQVCPTFLEEMSETMVARGRIHLAVKAEEGVLTAAPNLKNALTTCMLCLRCADNCPNRIDMESIIVASREQYLDKKSPAFIENFILKYIVGRRRSLSGAARMMGLSDKILGFAHMKGVYRKLLDSFMSIDPNRKLPSFHFKDLYKRYPETLTAPGNTKKAVYFPGCSATLSLINIADSVIRSLIRSGTDVILPRFGCCGMPAYSSGFYSLAEKSALENIKLIRDSGAEIIITSCGSCGKMLRDVYKEILGPDYGSFTVMDISEYLMANKATPGKNPVPVRVTYHDPCHLRRSMKVYEEPRGLLKSLPGIDYIEMTDADVCCGGGGAMSLKHYDLSKKVRLNKVNMFLRTHADVLASGCPSCIMHIEDGFSSNGVNARIVHPVELWDSSFEDQKTLKGA